MTPNKRDLKAYVRFDGTGRIVPGSLVLRRSIPKNGNWKEITAYECCNPLGPIQRCTINSTENPNPYSGPYFSMQRAWTGTFPYEFTLLSLNINGVEYSNGEILTINAIGDLQVSVGLDGRTYYTNTVDWINSLIPTSTGLVFYDDFNTVDHPENMLFQIIIQDHNQDSLSEYFYYKYDNIGLLYYTTGSGPLPINGLDWFSVAGDSNYICTNP